MKVEESYTALPLAASGQVIGVTGGGTLGGFLCTNAGTLALDQGTGAGGVDIVKTFDVAEGVFYPMPFTFPPGIGVYATLAGGAEGTFAVNNA